MHRLAGQGDSNSNSCKTPVLSLVQSYKNSKERMMEYVTRELAAYLVETELSAVPADVIHEARRALLNFVGCALGGANEDATDIALEVVSPFSGPRTSIVLGRSESLDPMH